MYKSCVRNIHLEGKSKTVSHNQTINKADVWLRFYSSVKTYLMDTKKHNNLSSAKGMYDVPQIVLLPLIYAFEHKNDMYTFVIRYNTSTIHI